MVSNACLRIIILAMFAVVTHQTYANYREHNPFWEMTCKGLFSEAKFNASMPHTTRVSSDPGCSMHGVRIGEADHPGPMRLGTFNPHQILNKEEVIVEWGPGIWAGAETSHTIDAMKVSKARFKKAGFHSSWSSPVAKHTADAGLYRGKASGTCVISHLKLKPYPAVPTTLAEQSSRLSECLVDVGNGTHMYVAAMYGPTHTTTFFDPWAILCGICTEVFDHDLAYKGPAVIMGDFNVDIDKIPRWTAMQRAGWIDAAAFDANRRGVCPNPTSKNKVRRSFILLNSRLAQALEWCDTIEEFEFDSHPLLAADLNVEAITRPLSKWWLPASTDPYMFDPALMETSAERCIIEQGPKFENALHHADGDEAMRQINIAFDQCLASSCVDSIGNEVRLPKKCFGRGYKRVKRLVAPSAPIVPHGRQDQFNPDICQPSMCIRLMIKQVRRLQSLESQLTAVEKYGNPLAVAACATLWTAVLDSKGFSPSFQEFVLTKFGIFVPSCCPGVEYLRYLIAITKNHVQEIVNETNKVLRHKRECRMLRDIKNGGANAFRAVRDAEVPPLHAIAHEIKVKVVPVRWPKQGRDTLKVEGECHDFDFQFPVYFQEQECFVTHQCGHFLTLDRHVKWRNCDDWFLTQKRFTSDPAGMQELTGHAWSTMWRRDPREDKEENWDEVLRHLQVIDAFPTLQYQPLNVAEWKRHAATTARKSARGACAYTSRDLAIMPDCLASWLLRVLMAIERGQFNWPRCLMIARVVMLCKTAEQPTSPLQTRPITIASRIYRNWAKYRSAQIIQHVQTFLPPQIAGTAAGVSADCLAARMLVGVEQALLNDTPRMGITVDLVKCFNQIPRIPILCAMQKLGIPWQYTTALHSMFLQLRRVLELSGEIGDEWDSTTGVPEGCAMSLVAMMSLTVWATQHILVQAQSTDVCCLAYADNWAVITSALEQLDKAVSALTDLVRLLRMRIAPDKSWTWATHTKQRRELKEIHIDGTTVPMKLMGTELGCDMSYCRKVSKKVSQKRIGKAVRVLKRVGKRVMPTSFKNRMAKQLVAGITGYGSELVYHTPSDLRTLRTATCAAMGRSRAGNNPYLTTHVTTGCTDISLALLKRKIFFWRRYFKVFPGTEDWFLQTLTIQKMRVGATAFLRRTLDDHGWKCLPHGIIQHERGWKINWVKDSKHHVVKVLELSWSVQVCKLVQHRSSFDAECLDVKGFEQVVKKLDHEKVVHSMNLAVGKHITNESLSHYAKGAKSAKCPFCPAKDSRLHRVWSCPGTAKHRDKHAETMRWLHEQLDVVAVFGLLPLDLTWVDWKLEQQCGIPMIRCLHEATESHVTVFTDGSAIGQGHLSFCVAASAYIQCTAWKVIRRCAEPVPGNDHSAFRAEVWAIVMAMRDFRRIHIFTDCSSVVENLSAILSARLAGTRPKFHDHEDLWHIVWELMSDRDHDDLMVTKVRAHQNISKVLDPIEKWKATMNDHADKLAKSCIRKHWKDEIQDILECLQLRANDVCRLHDFHEMWNQMNEEAIQISKKQSHGDALPKPAFRLLFDEQQAVSIPCVIAETKIESCIYTELFARRVVNYFHNLEWDFTQPNVSTLELYIDFALWSGTVAPALIHAGSKKTGKHNRSYQLPDQCPLADLAQCTLRQQSRVWSKMLAWLRENWHQAPGKPQLGCTSLAKVGYHQQHYGVPGTPRFRSGLRVLHELRSFFETSKGYRTNMDRRWNVQQAPLGGA